MTYREIQAFLGIDMKMIHMILHDYGNFAVIRSHII